MTTPAALAWIEPWPVLIDTLAAYRFTRLLVTDTLPPFARWRTRRYNQTARTHPEWAVGWVCAWCIGFWVTLLVVVLHTLVAALAGDTGSQVVTLVMLVPAIAAAVGMLADRQAT